MTKPKLDRSTDQGLNSAMILAAFKLVGMDLKVTQKEQDGGLLLDFQWKEDPRFRGSLFSKGPSVSLSLFVLDDGKVRFEHQANVNTTAARIILGKDVLRILRYMGFKAKKDTKETGITA